MGGDVQGGALLGGGAGALTTSATWDNTLSSYEPQIARDQQELDRICEADKEVGRKLTKKYKTPFIDAF